MSRENVEGFRRAVEAWNTGGPDAWERHLPEHVEWHDAPDVPDRTVHRGRKAVVGYLRDLVEVIGQFEIDLEEVIDAGEQMVAVFRINVHGRHSGVALDTPWIQIVDFVDGRPIRVRNFTTREQALEVVGLLQ